MSAKSRRLQPESARRCLEIAAAEKSDCAIAPSELRYYLKNEKEETEI